jgi:hypothetical protein
VTSLIEWLNVGKISAGDVTWNQNAQHIALSYELFKILRNFANWAAAIHLFGAPILH